DELEQQYSSLKTKVHDLREYLEPGKARQGIGQNRKAGAESKPGYKPSKISTGHARAQATGSRLVAGRRPGAPNRRHRRVLRSWKRRRRHYRRPATRTRCAA